MSLDAPVQTVSMTAKQFEFTPKEVLIKQGTHVILEIESLDVTHGFTVDHYGINVTIPEKQKLPLNSMTGNQERIRLSVRTFVVGHIGMKGKIIVE